MLVVPPESSLVSSPTVAAIPPIVPLRSSASMSVGQLPVWSGPVRPSNPSSIVPVSVNVPSGAPSEVVNGTLNVTSAMMSCPLGLNVELDDVIFSVPGSVQMPAAGKQPAPTPLNVAPAGGKVGVGLMTSACATPIPAQPTSITLNSAARVHMRRTLSL